LFDSFAHLEDPCEPIKEIHIACDSYHFGRSCWIAQNGRFLLGTFLLIRYGEVGCIHKYPTMAWTHQLS
jgi:hypothetical protein